MSWRLPALESREFAFALRSIDQRTGKNTILRHLHFEDEAHVNEALALLEPIHVWQSTARYNDPGARVMEQKGWQGADLAIDIDTVHKDGSPALDTNPERMDDPKNSTGIRAALLLAFSSSRASSFSPQEKSLLLGRPELHALAAAWVLRNVLGARDIHYTFSGNRGVHVYATDEAFVGLSRVERQEIVDLLTGTRVNVKKLYGGGYVEEVRGYGIQLDAPITTDVHRVIRTPGSVHGKTGRVCEPLSESQLVKNLRDSVAA